MKLGKEGLEIIKDFEGFYPRRYVCPAGYWTIGYGHVIKASEHFDEPITLEVGEELLQGDVEEAENGVNGLVQVPLGQNQFDALVSWTFNLGTGNLASSTLLRKLNDGDYEGAAAEFKRWKYGGGVVLPGLVRRRKAEEDLFRKEEEDDT